MIALGKEHYWKLRSHLDLVNFNCLFAQAVIEGTVSGRVYVDDISNPRSFYIVHRYGMSLLGGDTANLKFNLALRRYALNLDQERTSHEWMQVFPQEWNAMLMNLFKDALIKSADNRHNRTRSVIELNTRVNFFFDKDRYFKAREKMISRNSMIRVVENTADAFDRMNGSVVPKAFWDSSEDFITKGIGYSVFYEGRLAATSFSSFLSAGKLELGIETAAESRGKGLAERVCAELIDYCIERNLEPIWSCRLENTASYELAKKLGFVPSLQLPYYRLSN